MKLTKREIEILTGLPKNKWVRTWENVPKGTSTSTLTNLGKKGMILCLKYNSVDEMLEWMCKDDDSLAPVKIYKYCHYPDEIKKIDGPEWFYQI